MISWSPMPPPVLASITTATANPTIAHRALLSSTDFRYTIDPSSTCLAVMVAVVGSMSMVSPGSASTAADTAANSRASSAPSTSSSRPVASASLSATSSAPETPRNDWYRLYWLLLMAPVVSWRNVTHTPAMVVPARNAIITANISSLGVSRWPTCARMPSPVRSSCASPVAKPPMAVRPMKSSANGVNPAIPSEVSKPALRAMR
mmetsp:Transcript_36226/g.58192  ORF Transcript_36226/g.58192 Transcript_36226/m.58192 type:complete len:205 (+) Transcript_36226:386-1000(+)